MLYPEPTTRAEISKKGVDARKGKTATGSVSGPVETKKPAKARLSVARRVLSHSLDMAQGVMAGASSLDEALLVIRSNKRCRMARESSVWML